MWHYLQIQPVQRALGRVVAAALVAAVPTVLIPDMNLPDLTQIVVLFGVLLAAYVPIVLWLVVDETDRAVLHGIVRRVRPRPRLVRPPAGGRSGRTTPAASRTGRAARRRTR